ncbi:MAG: family 16 glycosylhydrolase [Williamsia sp.]|nr:family 16 glycosylhydrolase [Williamsia sp.]
MKKLKAGLVFAAVTAALCCGKGNDADKQPLPAISIADRSMNEGNGGTTSMEFTVTLSNAYSAPVSVRYSTIDGTAKSGEDYTSVSSQLCTWQPGETQKKIAVSVVADDVKEGDDTFSVRLSSPENGTLIRQTAVGTIRNDDSKVPFTNAGYDAPTSYPGYSLAWSEEFNGSVLDDKVWSYENGDGCPTLCGWGNNELENYTSRPDNLFFQDGKMIIEARQETLGGKNYTSARIKTQGKKGFKFGRIDIRAKLPAGKGIWPALWLMPQDNVYGVWPKSGEIDLMEAIGSEPAKILGTLHYGPGPGSTNISRNYVLPAGTFNNEFHVFSMEWKQDQVKLYVDNNLFSTVSKADLGNNAYPYNETFYLIVNLAVGGNLPGSPDASTYFPQWFILDYIRWYQ